MQNVRYYVPSQTFSKTHQMVLNDKKNVHTQVLQLHLTSGALVFL